ncbi:MAG: 23S rRNA (uracil(1939)-C(5))-methyltransferase RlmD [Oscillospiraceae bacterium]|nr:23S rRNA (uracil(1939)-C(5))-methyltransferase RlmD [Oscillospiraceae bacterium]
MDEIKKNQVYTAEVEGYSSTGAGVARILGRAVFVDYALVGEIWEILILKVTASVVYGKGLRCLRASENRVSPACPIFGKCGGCDLMHMSYGEELRFKLSRVNDAIKRVAGLDFAIDEIIGADEGGSHRYRNKAIFAVGQDENGKAVTGFFRERSHDIIGAPDCLIQTELSVRCAEALRSFMDENGISSYDEKTGKGQIRNIFTRCSLRFSQSVACVVSARGLRGYSEALVSALRKKCPELTGIVLCINKTRGNTVLAGDFHTLWGSEVIEDELCGLRFRVSPQSFYQVNPLQAEKLYMRTLDYASPDGAGVVLDLYCGTGTISLCLARGAKFVYGAEIVEAAVVNARQNAEANGIENAEFILGDAGKAAERLALSGVRPDAVVVDPPRKGLSVEAIEEISAMSPNRVVYVSCDPATLARDMKLFAGLGFFPRKGTAVDMFPRTAHVETCVLLSHKNPQTSPPSL